MGGFFRGEFEIFFFAGFRFGESFPGAVVFFEWGGGGRRSFPVVFPGPFHVEYFIVALFSGFYSEELLPGVSSAIFVQPFFWGLFVIVWVSGGFRRGGDPFLPSLFSRIFL